MTSDFSPFKSSEKIQACAKHLEGGLFGGPQHAQRIDVVAKSVKDRLVGWPYKTAPHVLEPQTRGLHINANGKG